MRTTQQRSGRSRTPAAGVLWSIHRMPESRSAASIAPLGGAVLLAVGGLVTATGWLGVDRLRPTLTPKEAGFGLLGLGIAVLLLSDRHALWRARAGRVVAGLVAALALAIAVELAFGQRSSPGWVAPATVAAFGPSGLALVLVDGGRQARRVSGWLLVAASGAVFAALTGVVFGVGFPSSTGWRIGAAVLATAGLLAVVVSALLRWDVRPAGYLRRDEPGIAMARHLLPVAVVGPFLLGFAHLTLERWGFGDHLNIAVTTLVGVGVLVVLLLIVARRLSEEDRRRRRADERLRRRFASSPIAESLVGLDGRYLEVNPTLAALLGVGEEELLGMTLEETVRREDRASLRAALDRLHDGEERVQVELRRLTAAHDEPTVLLTASLLTDVEGAPTAYVTQTIDLSEQKRAERERQELEASLAEAQRLESLGVLAGGIAHDFNNLLGAVTLGSELLAGRVVDEDDRSVLAQIQVAARRAAELTREMLAYAGKAPFALERLSLNAVVGDLAEIMRAAIPKTARVRLQLDPALPSLVGDSAQVHQVVLNLIVNAAEALEHGRGEIAVATGLLDADPGVLQGFELSPPVPGRYVFIEVADDGGGMEPGIRERIFDPFFTTKFAGRGLGLAAVLGIVRSHNGGIRVESTPGNGTTFTVIFPAAAMVSPTPDGPGPRSGVTRRSGTILVADDEQVVRETCARVLEASGYTVVQAADGAAAIEEFAAAPRRFDAVMLDLTMPGLGGEDVARAIRRLAPDVPIVIMSGFSSRDLDGELADAAVLSFLQKPFSAGDLLTALDPTLRRSPTADPS